MDRPLTSSVDLSNQSNELDSFGRLRVSQPQVLFESFFTFDSQDNSWTQSLTGSATITRNADASTVNLNVTAASGDKAVRRSRRYVPYQAGRSQRVAMSFILSQAKTNLRQRIGVFDDNDGIFMQLNGTAISWVVRTSTSGTPSDSRSAAQSDWNLDKLNGTGKSGITLDLTKLHLIVIDYGWQAVGSIRVGFLIDGEIVYVHSFNNGNVLTAPFMKRGTLPVRAEIENTGATSGASSLQTVCFVVMSESGFNPQGVLRAASTGKTLKTVGTSFVPLVSMRLKSAAAAHVFRPISHSVSLITNDRVELALIRHPTLTGASFASVDTDSIMESDTSASALTGGTIFHREFIFQSGNIATGYSSKSDVYESLDAFFGSFLDGTTEIFTIAARCFQGTADISAASTWREFP